MEALTDSLLERCASVSRLLKSIRNARIEQ